MAKIHLYTTGILVTTDSDAPLNQFTGATELNFEGSAIEVYNQGTKQTFPSRDQVTVITDANGGSVSVPGTDDAYKALVAAWFRDFNSPLLAGRLIGEYVVLGYALSPGDPLLNRLIECNGDWYEITEYPLLFNKIHYQHGGDGSTMFAVPQLQGRAVIGRKKGEVGYTYYPGQLLGAERAALTAANNGPHTHAATGIVVNIRANSGPADENDSIGLYPAIAATSVYTPGFTPDAYTGGTDVSGTTAESGTGTDFSIMQPVSVAVTYIVYR